MEDFRLSPELIDSLHHIAEMQNESLRVAKTMLAGFISLDERDIDFMDQHMDPLFDFMDPGSEVEFLMREYYAHISSFNPTEAHNRFEELENHLGYYTRAVLAAGLVAKELHSGQKDKGGADYFESHLLKVASYGFNWKEKIVGFLHDVAEDTATSADEALCMVEEKLHEISQKDESEWWEEWMEEILPYPAPSTFFIGPEDTAEIIAALNILNAHNHHDRMEYLKHVSGNRLALKVKLNDLRSNMDISRIPNPTEKDLRRIERYRQEYTYLLQQLN